MGEVFGSGIVKEEKGSKRDVGVDGRVSSIKMTLWDISNDGRSNIR